MKPSPMVLLLVWYLGTYILLLHACKIIWGRIHMVVGVNLDPLTPAKLPRCCLGGEGTPLDIGRDQPSPPGFTLNQPDPPFSTVCQCHPQQGWPNTPWEGANEPKRVSKLATGPHLGRGWNVCFLGKFLKNWSKSTSFGLRGTSKRINLFFNIRHHAQWMLHLSFFPFYFDRISSICSPCFCQFSFFFLSLPQLTDKIHHKSTTKYFIFEKMAENWMNTFSKALSKNLSHRHQNGHFERKNKKN